MKPVPDCPDCETDLLVESARVADRWRCYGCDSRFETPAVFKAQRGRGGAR